MIPSVYHLLQETANAYKDQVAARFYQENSWKTYTWKELEDQVNCLASGLIEIGVQPKDRVVIFAKTRIEWAIIDLAIMAVGAISVPIYHSSALNDVIYLLNDSSPTVIFVDEVETLNRCRDAKQKASIVKKIVCIDNDIAVNKAANELLWRDVIDESKRNMSVIKERMQHISEDDVATIVYTSGTTGNPKGAMLTHDNLLYEARAIEKFGIVTREDIQLLFLPLAHVFAKVLEVAWLKTGHEMVFAQSIDKIIENMQEIKPTIMASVPRIYEKVYAKVISGIESGSGVKGMLGRWALAQSEIATKRQRADRKTNGLKWSLAQKLVFSKIKDRLAELFGGRLNFFISGGAALSPNIAYFFKHAGVTILEGYGLTETTAATCVNLPLHNRIGTVGKPVPGTELKIAADGEVCIRGRGVFKGYWNSEDETKKCLTADGWFLTGDIGVLDQAGFLRITDRKKEIIVNAGGKNIAPQKIENLIKSKMPLVAHVLVYGDARPYLVAILVLDEINTKEWAKKRRIKKSYNELVKDKALLRQINIDLKEANSTLASYEQVKKFAILDHDFVIGDQLTPTLKVKRNVCYVQYKKVIDDLYN